MDGADQCEPTRDPRATIEMPILVSRYQKVTIEKVTNGFIIRVGCKTFVAKIWSEVAGGLGEYWDNPRETEEKYSV